MGALPLMSQKKFKPQIVNGGGNIGVPAPVNVVLRKDAERAAQVAYATGRRDAMLALAQELSVLEGQFIEVGDMVEAITKAAAEFDVVIAALERGEAPVDAEAEASAAARARLVLPS